MSQANINTTNIVNSVGNKIKNNKNNYNVIGILIMAFLITITLGLICLFKRKNNKNSKKESEF